MWRRCCSACGHRPDRRRTVGDVLTAAPPERDPERVDEAAPVLPLARERKIRTQWSLRLWLGVLAAASLLIAATMIVGGALALNRLTDARAVVIDRIDPAVRAAAQLSAAVLNQETGLRGYAITGEERFLEPYTTGQRQEAAAAAELRKLADVPGSPIRVDTEEVEAGVAAWRQQYAEPTLTARRAGMAPPDLNVGKQLFDRVRTGLGEQQHRLDVEGTAARARLKAAAATLRNAFIGIAVGLVALIALLAFGVRRIILRPISELAGTVRKVADGDFRAVVRTDGPREIVELGDDVDAMRQHIVTE